MKKLVYIFILFFAVLLLRESIYAQNINKNVTEEKALNSELIKSDKQKSIEAELTRLKHEDNSANLGRMLQLNTELEQLTGNNSTLPSPVSGGVLRYVEKPEVFSNSTEFINNKLIYNNAGQVRVIAGAVEQRGSTAGKIWAIVMYSADTLSPDTLKVYYSVNGGSSWVQYVSGNINPGDELSFDDMDLELIENVSGQKYLWATFGYKRYHTGLGNVSRYAVGSFVLQVPSLNGNFANIMVWPGADSLKRYYDLRITSDNARYLNTPYLYFACSFDSLDGLGNRVYSQKYARCLTPYSPAVPSISFMDPVFFRKEVSPNPNYLSTVYTDIAYFYNGLDSVIVSYSGGLDSSKLYFAKADINGNPPVTSIGPAGGSEPGAFKTYGRLSSNGNDNGSIVCVFRQFNAGQWNVKWFRSSVFGNFGAVFNESVLWGSPVNVNYHPEIVGVRNGNTHYVSFLTDAATDSIHYISVNSAGTTTHNSKMNFFSSANEIAPKALFRYVDNDSCLLLYSEEGPDNIYSASGCSGDPIGLVNNQLPVRFELSQNYPNPFNPVTNIGFWNADFGLVSLKIYDITGREIAILLNQELKPGAYNVDFDGGNLGSGVYFYRLETESFSDTKKMVLVK
ncbi:MAG: T9SS type A sorting domain-containing protein [Ignavibacteria bacterium]|nr:T9SS type A sorting domain-containing protein [Ignavibacteria bacterium]